MTTLAETRAGLLATLEPIDGWRVAGYIPDDVTPPVMVILPPVVPDYWGDLGASSMQVVFPVLLLVSRAVDRQQLDLFELIERTGARSVFAKIEANPSLGGLNVNAHVVNVEDFDTSQVGLTTYYGRVMNISVIVTRD